jgi:hypothetical protein
MKTLKNGLGLALNLMIGLILSIGISNAADLNPAITLCAVEGTVVGLSLILGSAVNQGHAYDFILNPVEFKGEHFDNIFQQVLMMNRTVEKKLVTVLDNVKNEIVLTEADGAVVIQSYDEEPTESNSQGDLSVRDYINQPVQLMVYKTFTAKELGLRFSRFAKDIPKGAFNEESNEFNQMVLQLYGLLTSRAAEVKFWNGAKTATKTAVAALTAADATATSVSTAHKVYVAAAPTSEFDGVITKLIYDRGAVGKRKKVTGTTITSSNIKAEYDKLYAIILPENLTAENIGNYRIFAPESHNQLITIYNNNPSNFKDAFIYKDGTYYFNNIRIEFVPIPENTMAGGVWSDFVWSCDATDDTSYVKMDFVAANSRRMFYWCVFTQEASVMTPSQKVLYMG